MIIKHIYNYSLAIINYPSIKYFFVGLTLLLQACASSRKWAEDEYLLRTQSIVGNKIVPLEQITPLLRQKPNKNRFFIIPAVNIYDAGLRRFNPDKVKQKIVEIDKDFNNRIEIARSANKMDKSKRLEYRKKEKLDKWNVVLNEGNWLMRVVGEKPVFYDSLIAKTTVEQIQKFLKEDKGFFQAQVSVEKKMLPQKRVKLTYKIVENQPTFFGDFRFITENPRIDSILNANKNKSLVKKGDYYTREVLSKERTRIEQLLRNSGYLFFNQQYVILKPDTNHFGKSSKLKSVIDSTKNIKPTDNQIDSTKRYAFINVVINEPSRGTHQAWDLNEIYFHFTNLRRKLTSRDTLESPDSHIKYTFETKKINYAYHVFDQRIKLRPRQKYSQTRLLETQRLIGNMDLFKFVNIDPDTTYGKLNLNIYTRPMEKFQVTDEIGLTYTQGLPGPYINVALKNRNTFGGAEIFETSVRFSIDGQTSFSKENSFYSAVQAGLNMSLTFPRLLFPRKLIYRSLRQNLEYYTPKTRLNLGYNYTNRPEYTRTNITASISYQGQVRYSNYNFTLSELSIVNTERTSTEFEDLLTSLENQGNSIRQSFRRAIVSSIYFIYTFNNNAGDETKKSHYIRFLAETGGNVLSLLSSSPLQTENKIFGLTYFQYWRFNGTFHYYLPLNNKNNLLAFRANVGLARPYGSSLTLPYEKFFFVGGGSSLRAWAPRRVGQGTTAAIDSTNGNIIYRFERPGEIALEGNVEWRFPIFSFVRGALFADAGNVWNWTETDKSQGSQFRLNTFWKQIAVGTGFGLRFNLPFLLFRVDLGYRVYDPARINDRPWVLFQRPLNKDFLALNLGIGYPF